MTDTAYYLSLVLNAALCISTCLWLRNKIKLSEVREGKAKSIYSWTVLLIGMVSGAVNFNSIVSLFRSSGMPAPYGHGEVIVSAIIFNLVLSIVLLGVGRICLGWRAISWRQ